VGVGAGCDHDDRDIAGPADGTAHLEPVDTGQHDVDQHDVSGVAIERVKGILTVVGLFDDPAFVLQGHLHRGADALVVLDGQNARSHLLMVPDPAPNWDDTRNISSKRPRGSGVGRTGGGQDLS
jgi:hypothetical protein